jgi:hypothetical protein
MLKGKKATLDTKEGDEIQGRIQNNAEKEPCLIIRGKISNGVGNSWSGTFVIPWGRVKSHIELG